MRRSGKIGPALPFRHSPWLPWSIPSKDRSDDLQADVQGTISCYFNKHNLKLQGDITDIHDQSRGKVDDMIYRVQAQVIF